MAIIRCPECGHQISDRAPVCPSCGVEIANRVTRCPQCGEVYFNDLRECPNCHHANMSRRGETSQAHEQAAEQETEPTPTADTTPPAPDADTQRAKKKRTTLLVAFIIAIIACGLGYYCYHNAQNREEQEAYEFAAKSDDPIVLQDYLDRYKDAPMAHRDSIHVRLTAIQQMDSDWTNAWVSNSKTALEDYLDKHPDSEHRAEALRKIDSLDWAAASSANSVDAYQFYLEDHPNGAYVDDANDGIKKINAQTVQPEERAMLSSLFKQFFQCINAKDENGLVSTVSPVISSFLGKVDASKNDVITFLHKLYNQEVASMTWRLPNDYKIDKKEIGDEQYEYTVKFSADQEVNKVNDTQQTMHYRIKAKVNPDGKITEFNMTRIIR